MKIIFLCLGTRGDVQPYVAAGIMAKAYGHEVTICTGSSFQKLVLDHGLKFEACSLDLMAILLTAEGKQIFNEGMKHPVKALKYAKEVINPLYVEAMQEFYTACKQQDVIVFHPKAFGAVDIAERFNIPCISMPLVPMIYPIKAFPNLAISKRNLGGFLNRLTYQLANLGAESNNIKDINKFRETILDLPKRKSGAYMLQRNNGPLPIVYPISKYLFEDVEEFDNHVALTGFPVLHDTSILDSETEKFIDGGTPPIVITFSSMPLKSPDQFIKKIACALRNTGNRAILITGNSGFSGGIEEHIFVKEYLPHEQVFKKAKGILHHGGVGTTAAALRSGSVQVMMPCNVDQPFWANRLYKMGYALRPLREKDSIKVFEKRFLEMETEEAKQKAKRIAEKVQAEHSNENIVEYIEKTVKNWK